MALVEQARAVEAKRRLTTVTELDKAHKRHLDAGVLLVRQGQCRGATMYNDG
jgi:hypothetical protein